MPALVEALQLESEHGMVRHECAEGAGSGVLGVRKSPARRASHAPLGTLLLNALRAALGSIATEDVLPILRKFREDTEPVVRESCEVALDMYEWETSNTFQYADGLAQIGAVPAAAPEAAV